jgi:hypothetical protein
MNHAPKGKLVIIGGSVDRGSFSESPADLKRSLQFFEKGILKTNNHRVCSKQCVSHRSYYHGI